MENTFKGFDIEEIEDAMVKGLKLAVEKKVCSKLDGLLNTENACMLDGNSTIYYTKGLYSGYVDGRNMEDVHFVLVSGKGSIGICSEKDI